MQSTLISSYVKIKNIKRQKLSKKNKSLYKTKNQNVY